MNLEEYHSRIDKAHTITGIPSYWTELQCMTVDRDNWREIASDLYAFAISVLGDHMTHPSVKAYEKAVHGE